MERITPAERVELGRLGVLFGGQYGLMTARAREHGVSRQSLYRRRARTGAALGREFEPLLRAAPEAIVVAAFGQLLPRAVLDLAPLGCLNVHPSLLPRWRGASPVQAALLHGDPETGVTIIRLTEQLDAGPILAQVRTPIGPDQDAPRLEARLAEIGARLGRPTVHEAATVPPTGAHL